MAYWVNFSTSEIVYWICPTVLVRDLLQRCGKWWFSLSHIAMWNIINPTNSIACCCCISVLFFSGWKCGFHHIVWPYKARNIVCVEGTRHNGLKKLQDVTYLRMRRAGADSQLTRMVQDTPRIATVDGMSAGQDDIRTPSGRRQDTSGTEA